MPNNAGPGNAEPTDPLSRFLASTAVRTLGLLLAGGAVLWILLQALVQLKDATAEVQLGLVIVLAVFMLMFLLFIMAAGFRQFDLADRNQALGLPEGTIRALISLILIMLFVILGSYLFRTVAEGVLTVRGLTADQVAALGTRVVTSTQVSGSNTFNVVLQGGLSDEGSRLAQQLVTTIGTLVVAVSGFYFGTSATAAGAASGTKQLLIRTAPPLPAGRIGQPYAGATLEADGGTGPYVWKLIGGTSLPAGLALSSAGRISGTPTAAGNPFTVQVEDARGATANKEFEVPITP